MLLNESCMAMPRCVRTPPAGGGGGSPSTARRAVVVRGGRRDFPATEISGKKSRLCLRFPLVGPMAVEPTCLADIKSMIACAMRGQEMWRHEGFASMGLNPPYPLPPRFPCFGWPHGGRADMLSGYKVDDCLRYAWAGDVAA
jgi:hypothetical protein